MDYDINNYDMLNKGAYYAQHSEVTGGWRPMYSAPHDGTVVEVRNTYGVAPWYGLFRWNPHVKVKAYDEKGNDVGFEYDDPKRWIDVSDGSSFQEDKDFTWRPYAGDPRTYVDPTGGAQNSMAYWRGAAAEASGRPVDAFESTASRNIDRDNSTGSDQEPWWSWFLACIKSALWYH
jgi:hypothetical protein